MEKLKTIETEKKETEKQKIVELDSDDDSDSCVSIHDSSDEKESSDEIAVRKLPVKNQNAKNFKKYQKPQMPKSFRQRNKQLLKRKKKRFFQSK